MHKVCHVCPYKTVDCNRNQLKGGNDVNKHKACTFGCGYDDVLDSKSPPPWPKKRLEEFAKNTHPLQIMVSSILYSTLTAKMFLRTLNYYN